MISNILRSANVTMVIMIMRIWQQNECVIYNGQNKLEKYYTEPCKTKKWKATYSTYRRWLTAVI